MAPAPMLDHPVVQSALDLFAGTIETIEERPPRGGAMNLQKLMKQAQEMQNRLQGELETLEVEAAVGGGMVAVTMNGHKQLLKVKIDREVLDPDDPEMLQDLVVAAVNEASRKVDEAVQSKIGGMAGGLPGMFR